MEDEGSPRSVKSAERVLDVFELFARRRRDMSHAEIAGQLLADGTPTAPHVVAKGADPTAVNREGQTTVDMANGPVQRVQPWPETIAFLERLGAKNNHKCLSC